MLHTFSMNSRDSACVQRMTKFVACLYGRYFLQSPLTTSAAANDLEFWKDLTEYAEIDSTIADASKKSVTRHMWYLVPEMITLALFNRKLPTNQKKEITEALLNFPRSSSFDAGKPNLLHPLQILKSAGPCTKLADFVNERSWLALHLVSGDTSWLKLDPVCWDADMSYMKQQQFFENMACTNDAAERAVRNVQEFAEMTCDESHRHNVILVANEQRKNIPQLKKSLLHKL